MQGPGGEQRNLAHLCIEHIIAAGGGLVKWEAWMLGLYRARRGEAREACDQWYSKAGGALGTHVSIQRTTSFSEHFLIE